MHGQALRRIIYPVIKAKQVNNMPEDNRCVHVALPKGLYKEYLGWGGVLGKIKVKFVEISVLYVPSQTSSFFWLRLLTFLTY